MRLHWFAVALLAALGLIGCESLRPPIAPGEPAPSIPARTGPRESVRNSDITPIAAQQNTTPTPIAATTTTDPDSLTLAADCLQRGDRENAAIHLEAYVVRHPNQLMFRAQLAELLIRIGRDESARVHFEQFVSDAQAATGAPRDHLVNAHTRLMEISLRTDDRFAEAFHRGVGLLLLVQEHEKTADPDAGFREEMLCKAIKALSEAKEMKPGDRRVRVYLAEALDRSGNRRAAEAERAATRNQYLPGGLTPTERKHVLLLP
jgi:hypothetical protein